MSRKFLQLYCYLLAFPSWAQQGIRYDVNPHPAMYVLAPTGFGPNRGQGLLQTPRIVPVQYQHALSDRLSVGAGSLPLVFAFGARYVPTWWYGAIRWPLGQGKPILNIWSYSIRVEPNFENERQMIYLFSSLTFGQRDRNWSVGVGRLMRAPAYDDKVKPFALMLHGMVRLRKKSCWLTENYLFSDLESMGIVSLCVHRRMYRRSALDFGWGTVVSTDTGTPMFLFPWLGWQCRIWK